MSPLYENEHIKIEIENSEIPWLKIFTQYPYKEMSEIPSQIRHEIYDLLHIVEKEMIHYYTPTKINIASFGNYVPHVHWHIMARFAEDSYYPEPMGGKKQRESTLKLPSSKIFYTQLIKKLTITAK